jgi:hypothetical protein
MADPWEQDALTAVAEPWQQDTEADQFSIRAHQVLGQLSTLGPNGQLDATDAEVQAIKESKPDLFRQAQRQRTMNLTAQQMQGAGPLRKGFNAVQMGIGQTVLPVVARLTGNHDAADQMNWIADAYEQQAQQEQEQRYQQGKTIVPPVAWQAARGAAKQLPATAAAAMAGGPEAAIAVGMAGQYNQSLSQAKDAGLSDDAAHRHAMNQTAIEGGIAAIFQSVGLGGLESALANTGKTAVKQGIKQALKEAGKETLSELTEENITSILQANQEALDGVDPHAMDPGNLAETAKLTTLQTLITMGLAKAPAGAAAAGQQLRRASDRLNDPAAVGTSAEELQRTAGQGPIPPELSRQFDQLQEQAQAAKKVQVKKPPLFELDVSGQRKRNFNAAWATPEVAQSAVDHLLKTGRTPEQIQALAENPSKDKFEEFGLADYLVRRNMPGAESRRAFGDNVKKYLSSLQTEKPNGTTANDLGDAQTGEAQPDGTNPPPLSEGGTGLPAESGPRGSAAQPAEIATGPLVQTPNFDLNLANPPTGQQYQKDVAGPADFDQEFAQAEAEQKARAKNRPDPLETGSRNYPQIVASQAAKWDMTPKQYQEFADAAWSDKGDLQQEREDAKKAAAKALGTTLGGARTYLQKLEDSGKDHAAIPNFDVTAESIAENYPALGWQHLVGDPSSNLGGKLWDLLKEGKVKSVPNRTTPEFHAQVERHLSSLERGVSFNPDEFAPSARLTAPSDALFAAAPSMHLPATNKLVGMLQRYMTSRGNLPQQVFEEKIAKEGAVGRETQQIAFLTADLKDAVAKAEGTGALTAKGKATIDAAVKGDQQALAALPEGVRAVVQQMREHIDTLSRRMIDNGLAEGNLQLTIEENMGSYVTRSYRVFDDPDWAKNVAPDVKNKAHAWLRAEYPDKSEAEIANIIGDMLYRKNAPIGILAGSTLGQKDLSITRKRKALATEIRALLGEHIDPLVNYTRSVTKMANLIANHEFLDSVKAGGEGKFLFARNDHNRPEGFHAEFASPEDSELAPLNGMMTTPEIKQAFEDVYKVDRPGYWMRQYMKGVLATKYSKTILSVAGQIRNFLGNIDFAIGNGLWRLDKMGDAFRTTVQGVRSDLPGWLRRTGSANAEFRQRLRHYQQIGVVDGSVHGGELREALRDAVDRPPGLVAENAAQKAVDILKAGGKLAENVYQANDNLWKIYAFENERARLKNAYDKAGQSLSDAELDKRASAIVRDTLPTYSMVPEAIKQLRRAPFIGSFVSFPAEVARTWWKSVKLSIEEIGDPVRREIGATRLAGNVARFAIPYALSMASRFLLGITDDDDEDLRQFMPPWEENSDILWLSNAPGQPRYVDLSWTFPSSVIRKPIHALLRGGATAAAGEAGQPFFGEDIITGKVLDVTRNTTGSGRQVYNPSDSLPSKAAAVGLHVGEAMEPGAVTTARRIEKGLTGRIDPSGRSYDATTEIGAATTGFRVRSLNLEESLGFRSRAFNKQQEDTRRIFTTVFNSRGTVTQSEVSDAYARMESARKEQFEDVHRAVLAAMRLGVPEDRARQVLVDGGMGKGDAARVVAGTYQPYIPSKDMVGRAARLPGGEGRIAALRGVLDQTAASK